MTRRALDCFARYLTTTLSVWALSARAVRDKLKTATTVSQFGYKGAAANEWVGKTVGWLKKISPRTGYLLIPRVDVTQRLHSNRQPRGMAALDGCSKQALQETRKRVPGWRL